MLHDIKDLTTFLTGEFMNYMGAREGIVVPVTVRLLTMTKLLVFMF